MAPSKGTRSAASSKKSKLKLSTLTLDSLPSRHASSSTPPPSSGTKAPRASRPLTSLSKPLPFKSKKEPLPTQESKGKAPLPLTGDTGDDQLWVDKYIPETEAELAVHKKKIEDVRRWLTEAFEGGPTGVLKKYRRILALTGPAGTGKTAAIHVLARELDFEIVEWRETMEDKFSGDDYNRESLAEKFDAFLGRASKCRAFLDPSSSSPVAPSLRRVILLEDIPNVLHPRTGEAFHDALEDYIQSTPNAPLVLIVSDAGTRGMDSEGDPMGSRRWGKQAIDVRSVIPPIIFSSPYFTEIQFNPIAPTLLAKALNNLLTRHFSSRFAKASAASQPSKEVVQMVIESAQGDIRSAIMALQFACVVKLPKGKNKGDATIVLEAVTRREQSLAMFHMLGKVLYNKRKGDPISPSASAKDRGREEALDSKILDSSDLPEHLAEHTRRGSRVNVDTLYADSPIDTSLFALYLHHNYTQFCNEVDECDAVCEWLSWIDASGGESWQAQQNPHQFHILALGTLHGLPSPVPRRSQKMFKPEFFDVLKRSKAAGESITDTEAWLNAAIDEEMEGAGRWARDEVVLEMGGVLKALDACGTNRPPSTHRSFSRLSFVHPARMPSNSQRMQQLGELEGPGEALPMDEVSSSSRTWRGLDEGPHKHTGGWLEDDDIQDF